MRVKLAGICVGKDKILSMYYNLETGEINTETGTSTQAWAEVGEIIWEFVTSRQSCPEVDLCFNRNTAGDLHKKDGKPGTHYRRRMFPKPTVLENLFSPENPHLSAK